MPAASDGNVRKHPHVAIGVNRILVELCMYDRRSEFHFPVAVSNFGIPQHVGGSRNLWPNSCQIGGLESIYQELFSHLQ